MMYVGGGSRWLCKQLRRKEAKLQHTFNVMINSLCDDEGVETIKIR